MYYKDTQAKIPGYRASFSENIYVKIKIGDSFQHKHPARKTRKRSHEKQTLSNEQAEWVNERKEEKRSVSTDYCNIEINLNASPLNSMTLQATADPSRSSTSLEK